MTDDCAITFVNMNLMFAKLEGSLDRQNYFPLGILYMMASLRQAGYRSELKDYQFAEMLDPFHLDIFKEFIGETADIVGISSMANLLPFVIHCAEDLKRERPDLRIVLGGVGASPVATEIIQSFPFIDYVVVGEGEQAIIDIVEGKAKQGVVQGNLVESLDTLPFPDYQSIDLSRYDAAPSLISSRGCPFKCQFCTEPFNFRQRTSFRSINNLMEEIQLVHKLTGRTLFLLQDDNFIFGKDRLAEFAQAVEKLDFPFQWKSFCRVDQLDEEKTRWAKESGCVQLRFGIESGSNRVLRELRKGITIERAEEAVQLATKHLPSVHASFMWGFPFETLDDVRETIRWMECFEKAGATILLFQWAPLAGSPLYERYKGNLEYADARYSNFVLTGHEVMWRPLHLIGEQHEPLYELIQQYPRIFPGFYCLGYEENILPKLQLLMESDFIMRKPLRGESDL